MEGRGPKFLLFIWLIAVVFVISATLQKVDAAKGDPYCFSFTWLGPKWNNESQGNGTCEKIDPKPEVCIDPLVITFILDLSGHAKFDYDETEKKEERRRFVSNPCPPSWIWEDYGFGLLNLHSQWNFGWEAGWRLWSAYFYGHCGEKDDGTPPNMTYLWKHFNKTQIGCRLTDNEACAKFTYYYNGKVDNITYLCARIIVDEDTSMTSGCETADVGGYVKEVCACRTYKGVDFPCNESSISTAYSALVLVLVVAMLFG